MLAVSPKSLEHDVKCREMLALRPNLRAFAISLCGDFNRADDLVQETLLRAYINFDSFAPGTNMTAWLFTILRNHFRSEHRKRKREVEDVAGILSGAEPHDGVMGMIPARFLAIEGEEAAIARLDHSVLWDCIERLPADQRAALALVVVSGYGYEVAAEILGCAVGTIKSRVGRARDRLAELMGGYGEGHRAEQSPEAMEAWSCMLHSGALDDFVDDGEMG